MWRQQPHSWGPRSGICMERIPVPQGWAQNRKWALPRLSGHRRVNWRGVTGRTALRKCYSPPGMLLPWGWIVFLSPRSNRRSSPAMETPGEPGAGPLGAPSPSNSSAPGHLETKKLVKLQGWPGGAGRDCRVGSIPGQRRGKGLGKDPSPWPPAHVWGLPPGQPRTRCTMCPVPAGCRQAGCRQVGPSGRGAP